MTRKVVVIWANCIGGSIIHMLNAMHPGKWETHWYQNFEYISEERELPDALEKADLFIYQNYRPKPGTRYDLAFILGQVLKPECETISFPTLHSISLQFGHEFYEPMNKHTVCHQFPHGQFKYGIQPVAEEYLRLSYNIDSVDERAKIAESVIENAMQVSFMAEQDILEQHEKSLSFLKEKSYSSNTPDIYDFVVNNFSKVRLWHNPYHPNGILLDKMCFHIFKCIGLPYKSDLSTISLLDRLLKDWVMPILPGTQYHYGMKFADYCFSKYDDSVVDTRSYLKAYLNALYVPLR